MIVKCRPLTPEEARLCQDNRSLRELVERHEELKAETRRKIADFRGGYYHNTEEMWDKFDQLFPEANGAPYDNN